MSVGFHANPNEQNGQTRAQLPPPPIEPTLLSPQARFRHPQYDPNPGSMPAYRSHQSSVMPHATMPMSEHYAETESSSSLRQDGFPHHQEPHTAYDGPPLAGPQLEPSSQLENQLRNMILSHDPSPGHQRVPSASTPNRARLPLGQTPDSNGNRRRPNQNQRKLQAQQTPFSFQNPPAVANAQDQNYHGRQQQRNSLPMNVPFNPHRQPVVNLPSGHSHQRPPQGVGSQPRMLYDPQARAGTRQPTGNPLSPRFSIAAQIQYIDNLARAKIPDVQISAEELAEKDILRDHLNKVCRKVVLDHEFQSNPDFPQETVLLKSFGSLSIGFATKDSDMDLVLVSPESKPDLSDPESEIPRKIEEALIGLGYGARLLTNTRVPIIKFCEKPSPELAVHLHLNRFWWEKERDMDVSRPDSQKSPHASEIGHEATEASHISSKQQDHESEQAAGPTQSETHGPVSTTPDPKTSQKLALESQKSSEESKTKPSAADTERDKRTSQDLKFDRAWLLRLSDYELIGLYNKILREGRCAPHQRAIISECLEYLATSRDDETLQNKRETLRQMPDVIEKCRPPEREDLDFPKSGVGTQCDINFSNQLALHNSLLLKCYSLCDPRVREMVLFVKAWTKIRMINSPYHGTLNSYGYVLMVLHYLMNVAKPPVIPNLQLAVDMIQNDPISSREAMFDGHNIQFFRNESAIEEMARNGVFANNQESLGSLLRGFFHFYANPPFGTFSWKDDVLSLRTRGGILTKVGKGWTGAKTEMVDLAGPGPNHKKVNHRYVVAIEDPFETGHNVARTVYFNGVVAIRDEFRRAATLISQGGIDPRLGPQDFFAQGKKYEHLQKGIFPHRKPPQKKIALPQDKAATANGSATSNTGDKVDGGQVNSDMPRVLPVPLVAFAKKPSGKNTEVDKNPTNSASSNMPVSVNVPHIEAVVSPSVINIDTDKKRVEQTRSSKPRAAKVSRGMVAKE